MRHAKQTPIKRAAILGAGVMGAQIAAHFVNAGIEVVLFDLKNEQGSPNQLVESAKAALPKMKPEPLGLPKHAELIQAANYEDSLSLLQGCDFVLEAISERLDWKESLYQKISPYLKEGAILASNTSGLSINHLAEFLSPEQRTHFCGVHFFNPPRYMSLVELIPCQDTASDVLEKLTYLVVSDLGKQIVMAKDTPNFIANRVGVFSMLITLKHAETYQIPFEVVDALTGPLLGRPKSATFRTADVVGLDTFAHTITTMREGLKDDPWHAYYSAPAWLDKLLQNGALGQKTKRGVYTKKGRDLFVYDLASEDYRPADKKPSEVVLKLLAIKDPKEKFQALMESKEPEAQFLWSCFRDLFHYCAYHLESIANTTRDVDQAIRWGFGWKQGPFETWQLSGWSEILSNISKAMTAEQTLVSNAMPAWVNSWQPYDSLGAFSPVEKAYVSSNRSGIYQRQPYPELMLLESLEEGTTVFETDAVRLWHTGDDIAVLSFKSKMCVIGTDVLTGISEAVDIAERDFSGLVIWQRYSDHFSAGANLKEFVGAIEAKAFDELDKTLDNFQKTCLKMRYSTIPTIAAARGYVFGGGCELMLHCDATVAAFETYMGLVEVGVGLLPAGGGCKEMALRASEAFLTKEPFAHLETYFRQIAMGEASKGALAAQKMGYLRPQDEIVMNPHEILHVAKAKLRAMSEARYRPPVSPKIQVCGRDGIARLQMGLVNYQAGGMISSHDYQIALKIAHVLCGGDVDSGSLVDEAWLLRLEREAFVELAGTKSSLERILHMLKTGKPLRN